MQAVQPQGFIPDSVEYPQESAPQASETAVTTQTEPEAHTQNQIQAQAQQELFNQGVQSGGVVRARPVEQVIEEKPTDEERLTAFIKAVMDEIGLEVQQQGIVSFMLVSNSDIDALDAYKKSASPESSALFTHFTSLLMAHYGPIVSQLPQSYKPAFFVAIQGAIIPKMAHAVEEIAKIAPEFLKNLVLVAAFHVHIAKQGQIMKSLEALEPADLQSLQEALASGDKAAFIVESTLEVIQELKAFLEGLPEQIRDPLKDGFIAGIQEALKNR